jgi:hypothetical protein
MHGDRPWRSSFDVSTGTYILTPNSEYAQGLRVSPFFRAQTGKRKRHANGGNNPYLVIVC